MIVGEAVGAEHMRGHCERTGTGEFRIGRQVLYWASTEEKPNAGGDGTSSRMISRGRAEGDTASGRHCSSSTPGLVGEVIPDKSCRVGCRILAGGSWEELTPLPLEVTSRSLEPRSISRLEQEHLSLGTASLWVEESQASLTDGSDDAEFFPGSVLQWAKPSMGM